MKMIISDINCINKNLVESIQGDHGYSQLGSYVDIETKVIGLVDSMELEFLNMAKEFKSLGFSVAIY